ncbi:MAG: hypothetical protein AAF926_05545, partial [Pseudomonadota bacterium]
MMENDLLSVIRAEFDQSIGFEHDGQLSSARETALRYFKGDMSDLPVFGDRSKTVSTDIADTIESILPDIVEILTGSEEVASFQPENEDDEAQAQQETDYINHVVFEQNNGFEIIYSSVKDACLTRTGLFRWQWQEDESLETQNYAELTDQAFYMARQQGWELVEGDVQEVLVQDPATGAYDQSRFVIRDAVLGQTHTKGRVVITSFPSEDFAVAPDTVRLRDASYCVARIRTRKQDLIDEGMDEALVRDLSASEAEALESTVRDARDVADDENTAAPSSVGDLAQVTVHEHHIRVGGDILRVITDTDNAVILDAAKVSHIQVSAICPFPIPHRFYGLSLADKLIEVQRVKTGLLRSMLDNVSFSLNQRMEVADSRKNENTMADLINNTPGAPIRTRESGAVNPVRGSSLTFDFGAALETADMMGERRTGVLRGQQGLDSDALHDTASGALTMMTEGQKRVRMMARIFA